MDSISVEKISGAPYGWLPESPEGYFEIEVHPEAIQGSPMRRFKPELDFLHQGDVFEDFDRKLYVVVVAHQIRHGDPDHSYMSWLYIAVPGARIPRNAS